MEEPSHLDPSHRQRPIWKNPIWGMVLEFTVSLCIIGLICIFLGIIRCLKCKPAMIRSSVALIRQTRQLGLCCFCDLVIALFENHAAGSAANLLHPGTAVPSSSVRTVNDALPPFSALPFAVPGCRSAFRWSRAQAKNRYFTQWCLKLLLLNYTLLYVSSPYAGHHHNWLPRRRCCGPVRGRYSSAY